MVKPKANDFDSKFKVNDEIRFKGVSRINIIKISRTKTKSLFLTNIHYIGNDGFGLKYSCCLTTDSLKNEYCEFSIDERTRMFSSNISIASLYYKENNKIKEFSFDISKQNISKHQVDGERYRECLSIYAKTE